MSNLHNLAIYSDRMAKGDYDAVYEYFDEKFRSNVTKRVNPAMEGDDIRHKEHEFWEQSKNAFPDDMDFKVNLVIEKDDFIVSNWTLTGTHNGEPFYDIPANGEAVEINGTAILRFEDGKVVEHWGGPHCMNGIGLYPDADK